MSENKELWDEWNRGGGPRYPHTKVVQFLFRRFPDPNARAHLDVLDLGCGSGVHMVFLAREGFRAHGRDLSSQGVENTRLHMSEDGLTFASLLTGSVLNIDSSDESFDAVICIGVLDCAGAECLAPSLKEIARVLKPGGGGLVLFASDLDFRIGDNNPLNLHGFTDVEVQTAANTVRPSLQEVWIDRFITTYENGKCQQNEYMLTLLK